MNKTMKDMKQLIRISCLTGTVTAGILNSLLLFGSCSQGGDGIPDGATYEPLVVKTVSRTADGAKTNTRATALPVPVTGGRLWVGIRGTDGYNARTGLIYNYSGGAWTCATAVPLGKDPISLYAYWPQDEYAETGGTVPLTTQPYADNKDLCYALSGGENVCSAHPSAGFVLNHAYARLKVDLTFSALLAGTATLEDIYVSGSGLYTDGTLVLVSGFLVPGTLRPEVRWQTSGQTMESIGWKYTGDMLVVPSAAVTGARLVIRIRGINYAAAIGSALAGLEAGKQYRIQAEVKVNPSLVINKVEVEDWKTGTPQSGETQFE